MEVIITPDMVDDRLPRYRVWVEKTNPNGESVIEELIVEVPKDDLSVYSVPLHKKLDCGDYKLEIKRIVRVR